MDRLNTGKEGISLREKFLFPADFTYKIMDIDSV